MIPPQARTGAVGRSCYGRRKSLHERGKEEDNVRQGSTIAAFFCIQLVAVTAWPFSLPKPPANWKQTVRRAYERKPLRGFATVGGETVCWTSPAGEEVWITLLTCESPTHASIALSKYLSDLTSRGQVERQDVSWPEGKATVHGLNGYGVVVAAQIASQVVIVGSDRSEELRAGCAGLKLLGQTRVFTPATPHPVWLDAYQRYAVNSFDRLLTRLSNDDPFERLFDFCKEYGIGLMPHIDWGRFEIEDGVFDFSQLRWSESYASVRNIPWTQMMITDAMPLWLVNQHPEYAMQRDPETHLGTWSTWDSVGNRHASPALDAPYAYAARWAKALVERARRNPMLTGYYLGDGWPGAEDAYHGYDTQYYDYSENGQQSFRGFLRRERRLSLADVGRRWYDDEKRFYSWEEVTLPHWSEVVGYGAGVFDLAEGWRWQAVPKEEQESPKDWFAESYDDSEWVRMAPRCSVENLCLPAVPARLRCKFSVPQAWLDREKTDVHLCAQLWSMLPGGSYELPVYLNGKLLRPLYVLGGEINPLNVAVNVTGTLRPGGNLLALMVPQGRLYGPVFFRHDLPKRYPYLGRGLNQRWCDFRDWQEWHLMRGAERMLRTVRALDPERPIVMSGPNIQGAGEHTARLFECYGAGGEFTGSPAFLFPWHKGLGYVYGRPGCSEEGGTTDDLQQQAKQLGWLLTMAHLKYYQYWCVENFYWPEKKLRFFKENLPIYRALGKFDWAQPQIALFKSSLTHRYFYNVRPEPPWSFDLGRGELQSLGLTNVYVTEHELLNGRVRDYPALWDLGSQILSPEVVAALEEYVRQGGTFVAIHLTGQHLPAEPDVWPISRLTGFSVKGQRRGTKLTLQRDCWLLPRHQRQTYISDGVAIDWLGKDRIGADVSLKAQSEGTRALATWEDGTVAIGERRLGKGRVVILGSGFWRGAQDVRGVWLTREQSAELLDDMMDGLGLYRPVRYDERRLWMADCITNDGRDRWITAFNTSFDQLITPTIHITCPRKPERILEVISGQPLPFTYERGEAILTGQTLAPLQKWILQIKRASLGAAVPHWFEWQRKYWDKLPESTLPPMPRDNSLDLYANWKFKLLDTTADQATDTDWARPGFDDESWQRMDLGMWETQGVQGQGIGRYRKTFTVPAQWKGQQVFVWVGGYEWLTWWGRGRLYVNGERLFDWQTGWPRTDLTDRLKPRENLLALEIDGHDSRGHNGLIGTVALYTRPKWAATFELHGQGMEYASNLTPRKPVDIPGTFSGQSLAINFEVPSSWKGKRVWLQVETGLTSPWIVAAVCNESVITRYHPTGNLFEWIISPDLKFGGSNRLRLMSLNGTGLSEDKNLPVKAIRLLVEEPVTAEPKLLPPS